MENEINEKKTIYFVIAIIIMISLGIILILHFNNKEMVAPKNSIDNKTTTTKTTTTTTEITTSVISTTKKVVVKELKKEVQEEVEESPLIFNDIDNSSQIVIKYLSAKKLDLIVNKLNINEVLKNNNIIALYDIGLFYENNKQDIIDNNIVIRIPFNDELKGYDNYKVAYINDSNNIEEYYDVTFNDGYLEFKTTHLSKYAIIGTMSKKEVDLNKTTISVYKNNEIINNNEEISLIKQEDKQDKLTIKVNNDYTNYKLYYGIKYGYDIVNYLEYKDYIDYNFVSGTKYKLFVKLVVDDKEKVFELNYLRQYNIIVNNEYITSVVSNITTNNTTNIVIDPTSSIVDIGKKNSEDNTESDYKNKDNNDNILIDIEPTTQITNQINDSSDSKIQTPIINIKGNMYIIDETDLSSLELTGYLVIDTNENITFNCDQDNKIDFNNIYTITITSKEFSLNDKKYTYYIDESGNIVINKVIETDTNLNDIISNNYIIDKDKDNNLLIKKNEEITP